MGDGVATCLKRSMGDSVATHVRWWPVPMDDGVATCLEWWMTPMGDGVATHLKRSMGDGVATCTRWPWVMAWLHVQDGGNMPS